MLSFWEKRINDPFLAAAFIYSELAKRHYFVDGNKRTSHVLAKSFLATAGFHFEAPYKTAVSFIVSIAMDDKTISQIRKWLERNSRKIVRRTRKPI